ncbi:MAG: hypothetical protein LQ343_005366 [Gyalolechia ehrenbergii]|nr:MAG: hypothetical protein LQ343_005366 [Gyalolechia ehrenbergii]
MSPRDSMRFFREAASDAKEILETHFANQNARLESCLDHNEILQTENERLSKQNEKLRSKTYQQQRWLANLHALEEQVRMVRDQSRVDQENRESQLHAEREMLMKWREDLDCKAHQLDEATQKQEQQRALLEANKSSFTQHQDRLRQTFTARINVLRERTKFLDDDRKLCRDLIEEHRRGLLHDLTLLGKLQEMPRSKALTDVQECQEFLRGTLQAYQKGKERKCRLESTLLKIEQLCASQEESNAQGDRMALDLPSTIETVANSLTTCDEDWLLLSDVGNAPNPTW